MELYGHLKNKWHHLLEHGEAASNFDTQKLAPGKFCVLYSDVGSSGPCYSATEAVGVFEDARDFLGFLRFAEIPRVLDFDTGTNREPFPDVGDAYLLKYEGGQREKIDHLLGRLDLMLKRHTADMISASELSIICDRFNEAFDSTNPTVQILALGTLAQVLSSDHFEEALQEDIEDEVDEDEKPVTLLKRLLHVGEFDEGNHEHLSLAKDFLTQQVYA